jgi:hypothetical protein
MIVAGRISTQFFGKGPRLLSGTGANHDRMTNAYPSLPQSGPEIAGPSRNRDNWLRARSTAAQSNVISVSGTSLTPAFSRASRTARAVATPVGSSP